MTRPAGRPQDYATGNLATPGYTSLSSALRPSNGVAIAGLHQPERSLPSRYANHRDYDHARRLQDLDAIEIMNWPTPGEGDTGICNSDGNQSVDLCAKLWDPQRALLFVASTGTASEDIWISYDDGVTWASDLNSASAVWQGLASSPTSTAAAYEVGGAGRVYCQGIAGGTWTSQALTSCTNIGQGGITFDPYENCYWVVGEHSGSGGVWRLTNNQGSMPMTQNVVDTGDTPDFYLVAAGATWKLCANDTEFWRWPTSVAGVFVPVKQTTPLTGPLGGSNAVELRYLPEDDLMVLVARDSFTSILVSSDGGGTWVDKSANLPADFNTVSGTSNASAVRGSIFACPGELDGNPGILWSGDACESFNWIPDPMARHTLSNNARRLRVTDRRWGVAGYAGTGNHKFCFGLRMGA